MSVIEDIDPSTGACTIYYESPTDPEDYPVRDENNLVDLLAPPKKEVVARAEERKKIEDAKLKRIFPNTDMVYHFHPIAFVNHMKLIYGNHSGSCTKCGEEFTYEQIKKVFPSASKNESLAKELVRELNAVRIEYGIDTCQKKAHLIAQFGAETNFSDLKESLYYTTEKALKSSYRFFRKKANKGKINDYLRNPEKLAKLVYYTENKSLGNKNEEDG